jgi:TonB family protein
LGRGSVVVNFDVRPDGSVARAEVASSSHRGLNEAALSAVAAWRFKPISETLPGVVELKFE